MLGVPLEAGPRVEERGAKVITAAVAEVRLLLVKKLVDGCCDGLAKG